MPSTDDFGEQANIAYKIVSRAFIFEEEDNWIEANKCWQEVFGPIFLPRSFVLQKDSIVKSF